MPELGHTVCGGGCLQEGDFVLRPFVLLQERRIAIVMAPREYQTLAVLHVHHELKVPGDLQVCLFFARADIEKLKEGLCCVEAASESHHLVFFGYNACLHQDLAKAFDVQVYLDNNVLDVVARIGRLQVFLQLIMKLMGSRAATLLSLSQELVIEQRTVAINDKASKCVGYLCCAVMSVN